MNWAVVIGCDEYWKPTACLRGAVRDALAMREWLVAADGGEVPAENVILRLSPTDGGMRPADSLAYEPADNEGVQSALAELAERSGGEGNRLWFYFSGHGALSRIDFVEQAAIVPEDFTPLLTDRAISVTSIWEYFASLVFSEQLLFVDACRNIPFEEEEFAFGRVARPRRTDYKRPVSPQYLAYATSRGLMSTEESRAGDEGGAFTGALLDALRGSGAAKTWDRVQDRYVVRWSSLFGYVERNVRARKHRADADGRFIQVPQQAGEHTSEDPELARFEESAFSLEPLTLLVDPGAAAGVARLTVLRDDDDDTVIGPPAAVPHRLALPPRSYTVKGVAAGYRARRRSWHVDLYAPAELKLEFDDEGGPSRSGHLEPGDPSDGAVPTLRGIAAEPGRERLRVQASDPMAIVEVAEEGGRLLATAPGAADVDAPGWFRIRVTDDAGHVVEQTAELEQGERRLITLRIGDDGPRSFADFVGADARVHGGRAPSSWLRQRLGGGASLMLAIDGLLRHKTKTTFELRGAAGRVEAAGEVSTVIGTAAMASMSPEPGPKLLTVRMAAAEFTLPVIVFADRPALVVIEQRHCGPLVLQFSSVLTLSGLSGHIELRRLDAAQRFAALGRPDRAWHLLARARPGNDPLADCLAAYLRLRLGVPDGLPARETDTELPDRQLLGTLRSNRSVEGAADEILVAGLPIFQFGLQALADIARDPGLDAVDARRLPEQVVTVVTGGSLGLPTGRSLPRPVNA